MGFNFKFKSLEFVELWNMCNYVPTGVVAPRFWSVRLVDSLLNYYESDFCALTGTTMVANIQKRNQNAPQQGTIFDGTQRHATT